MFKKTAAALMLSLALVPSVAPALSLPTLLPTVSYPQAPAPDLTPGSLATQGK